MGTRITKIIVPLLFVIIVSSVFAQQEVKYWALIINGDRDFVADTDYMYHVIRDHYAFDDVYYLSPAYPHPGVDTRATKSEVRSAITDWLANRSDGDDVIVIYFSGHGGGYNAASHAIEGGRYDAGGDEGNEIRESMILEVDGVPYPGGYDANGDGDTNDWVGIDECLWIGNEQYWDDEMADDLNSLNYARLIVILDAGIEKQSGCFSGGFIDDISAAKRIIMTATHETTYAWGDMDGDGYSEWSEVFIDALHHENTHYNNGVVNEDPIDIVDADANNDGRVSLKEAWDYAWNHDDARLAGLSIPWLDDDGNGLPTYINEADQLDPDDGDLAANTWLPFLEGSVNRSIADGLAYLRWHQNADGSWSAGPWGDVGVTSLAVLCFLNQGYTEESDPVVRKAIQFILSRVRRDGRITTGGYYDTYETSLALIALRATNNPAYNDIINNAKDWLIASQWDESCLWGSVNQSDWRYGGFGYGWSSRPDLSNTQFALMALSAAGLPSNSDTWVKAIKFLERCQNRASSNDQPWAQQSWRPSYNDGGFIYLPGVSLAGGTKSYGSMTAAGIWSMRLSGISEGDLRVVDALNWIRTYEDCSFDDNPNMYPGSRFQYYYYLAVAKALVMCYVDRLNGIDWYERLSSKLVELQHTEGYWRNPYTGHGSEHYPAIATSFAILALQTRQLAPAEELWASIILESNADLHVYDPQGRHTGMNYDTGQIEEEIPDSSFTIDAQGRQIITLRQLQAGTYRIELVGTGDGEYSLTVEGYRDTMLVSSKTFTRTIRRGETQITNAVVGSIAGALTIYVEEPKPVPGGLIAIPGDTVIDLTWNPVVDPDLLGYRVYYGTAPRSYGLPIDVGNTTSYRLTGLINGVRYYIAVTAYYTDGRESGFSTEVSAVPRALVDVSSYVRINRFHFRFNRYTGQASMRLSITNTSDASIFTPIHMIIDNITVPTVSVANPDGTPDDGKPYFDYSSLIGDDNTLSPGETSGAKQIIFNNPQRRRFAFDIIVMGRLASGEGAPPMEVGKPHRITIVVPVESRLAQNYPNPFNAETWIPYELAEDADVIIRIYNLKGELIRTLNLGHKQFGSYFSREKAAYWDGRNERGEHVSSGVYFYILQAGEFKSMKKMVIIK